MNYRRDIDGLRALAIILVMIFHGGLGLFPSGFIGVDIFFVISGFLITSIIKGDIEKGRFSLANFYIRRAWRIQPALLATVIITCLVAIFFYLPADFEETIKSANTRYYSSQTNFIQESQQVTPHPTVRHCYYYIPGRCRLNGNGISYFPSHSHSRLNTSVRRV